MQEANVGSWTRESQVSVEMQESVRELNHRFLDLVASSPCGWATPQSGFASAVSERVAPLTATQKAAAANCPYALFDLRFNDHRHWQMRLQTASPWHVADPGTLDAGTLEFVRLALFFAWHVASTSELAAQLLLGMQEDTAAAFRAVTIDCLPSLVASEATHLTARWNGCARYWSALTEAASRPNAALLRRIQLYGLQLAAAERLG